MNERYIAVCDTDPGYALSLGRALESALYGHYRIMTFSGGKALHDHLAGHDAEAAIISESAYRREPVQAAGVRLIILQETPDFVEEGAVLIDRFQARDDLVLSVIRVLPDGVEGLSAKRQGTHAWKVIGVYSPIRRCLQTSFALSLGQQIGADHRVLYMNFESFSGFSGWFDLEFGSDMVDLLYYFDCEKDKLALRIPPMVHRLGGLDILPPAESGYESYDRTGTKWTELFEALEAATDYEYLILDLTDSMNGLLEVMEYCDRIYTLVRSDTLSQCKLAQYERWMTTRSKADIVGKTLRFELPEFTDMPVRPDMLTHCELAGYVRAIVSDDRY